MELLRLESTVGNKVYCEVQEVCSNYFSVLAYDWNGDLWVEKFVTSEVEAVALCHKMFKKYTK